MSCAAAPPDIQLRLAGRLCRLLARFLARLTRSAGVGVDCVSGGGRGSAPCPAVSSALGGKQGPLRKSQFAPPLSSRFTGRRGLPGPWSHPGWACPLTPRHGRGLKRWHLGGESTPTAADARADRRRLKCHRCLAQAVVRADRGTERPRRTAHRRGQLGVLRSHVVVRR